MGRSIKIAAIITYLTIFLGVLISLVTTPYIVTTLGKSEYGIYSLVTSIIAYVSILDLGFGSAVIRFNSKYLSEEDAEGQKRLNGMFLLIYSLIGTFSLVLGVLIILNLDYFFGDTFRYSELDTMKSALFIAMLNVSVSFPLNIFSSIINAHEKFVFLKSLNLIKNVFTPLSMVLMLFFGHGSTGMMLSTLILTLIIGLINVWYCMVRLSIRIKFFSFEYRVLKEIISYSFFIFLSSVAYQIFWNTDQFIIGGVMGASAIAVYAVATQMNVYFTSICNVIAGFYLPKLTKMIVKGESNLTLLEEMKKVGRVQAIIVGYVLSGFILFGANFIELWVGSEYGLSFSIALIIIIPQVVSIVQSLFATMLEAMNKHRIKAIIYLSMALLNVGLSLLLIPKWGVIGGAIATAIGMLLNAILNNLYYIFALKFKLVGYWKVILSVFLPVIILTSAAWIVVRNLIVESYIMLSLNVCVYTVGYMLLVWFFIMKNHERRKLFSLLKNSRVNKKIKVS